MIAISKRQALSVLTERGANVEQAIAALGRVKPAAHYDGEPYYDCGKIWRTRL